jgi:hypothetical protein
MTDLEILNHMEEARQSLYKAEAALMETSEFLSVELEDAMSAIVHATRQIRVAMEEYRGV